MDEKDNEINPNDLADQYPVLWEIFTPIAKKNITLLLNYNPSLDLQLTAVNQDGNAIQYIKNPSEEVQLAAVKNSVYAIQSIKNPTEEVQLFAVKKVWQTIEYIENPSEQVQLASIRRNTYAYYDIKNPTPKVVSLVKSLRS